MNTIRAALVILALLLVATPALAHVPSFPEDNTTPKRAVEVPDAVKSWSFYDRLSGEQTRYYRFSLEAGDRLRVGTFTPATGEFTPSVVLMSPGLAREGSVPPGVTVPEGMGAVVVRGERPERATYEMFAPSANYHTVDVDRPVETDRTYLVAVYEPSNLSGQVGVTIGYAEEFSAWEYVTVPFDLVRTHLWEGQHPLVVFAPWLLVIPGTVAVLRSRRRTGQRRGVVRAGLVGAALLIVATGASTLLQMGIALATTGPTAGALVTSVFAIVPLLCGGWTLRVSQQDAPFGARTRVGLAVAGVASLVTWAGFVVGPAILLTLAVTPTRVLESQH